MTRVLTSRKRLTHYGGRWVAMVNSRVIAHARSLPELMRIIEKNKLRKKAAVMLVPRKGEGPYIL